MVESDFLSYNSIYNRFSKGPKSIYYALGDEMLPGAILNVPQDDEDDEWGRTERIALERVYDFIGRIYKTLFDPYNSMPEISLIPGEAGSELNIAKNMVKLIGRPGIEEGIFNLSIPKLKLGNVEINGNTNKITIGSGLELSSNLLSLSSLLTISNTSNKGSITFKNVKIDLNDSGTVKSIEINVDGKKYTFTKDGLVLDVGLNILAAGSPLLDDSGNLITKNIYPRETREYTIGAEELWYHKVYSEKVSTYYLCGSFIYPLVYDLIQIGKTDYSTTIQIYAENFELKSRNVKVIDIMDENVINLGSSLRILDIKSKEVKLVGDPIKIYTKGLSIYASTDDMVPYFNISTSSILTVKDIIPMFSSIVKLGNEFNTFGTGYIDNIFVRIGKFSERIESATIFPLSDISYDIGSPTLRFNKIYARNIYNLNGIFNEGSLTIKGDPIVLRSANNTIAISADDYVIEANRELVTRSLRPITPDDTIGTVCGAYRSIFLRDWNSGLIKMIYIEGNVLKIN